MADISAIGSLRDRATKQNVNVILIALHKQEYWSLLIQVYFKAWRIQICDPYKHVWQLAKIAPTA